MMMVRYQALYKNRDLRVKPGPVTGRTDPYSDSKGPGPFTGNRV